MTNGWTGAQYSLFRVLFGLYLSAHIARWMPWGAPKILGLVASVAWTLGFRDRVAAVILVGALGASTLGGAHREPALPILAWILLAHVVAFRTPPFGSWDARGRLDPGGGFRVPSALLLAHRIALVPAFVLAAGGVWPRTWALVFLLLAACDPGWIPRYRAASAPALVLYDGGCGFCHASVRVLLAEDTDGRSFRFAPLEGERGQAALTDEQRREVGDTIVVLTPEGGRLSRSDAACDLGARLGGGWRVGAALLAACPPRLRDAAYDVVARVRRRLFAAPKEACPILPPALRARFEA